MFFIFCFISVATIEEFSKWIFVYIIAWKNREFNHVYDACTYPYSILVPGYSYHTFDNGFLTNSSGCGNDLNSTKKMIRKLIIDTLMYFKNCWKGYIKNEFKNT